MRGVGWLALASKSFTINLQPPTLIMSRLLGGDKAKHKYIYKRYGGPNRPCELSWQINYRQNAWHVLA